MDAEVVPDPNVDVPSITPQTFLERLRDDRGTFVLDARAADEFDEWHVEGPAVEVVNIPYYELLDGFDEATLAALPDDRPVLVLCAEGGASEFVAGLLVDRGFEAVHLAGGMAAWAELYVVDPVTRYDGPGTLLQYRRPATGCLSYLVIDGDEAAVVDPLRASADRYLADAGDRGATLRYAVDTHVHADHVSGVRALAERGVEGVVPAPAADRGLDDVEAFTTLDDGDPLAVGDVEVVARHAPGHTSGMLVYRVGDDALLTGDALFVDSVGRPDLEAGADGAPDAAARLHESLRSVVLPHGDDVVVGGAHYGDAATQAEDGTYTATLGELRASMPVLDADRETFVERVLADVPPRPANHETIVEANLGRTTPDDDEAFRLELGPNRCATSRDALTGD